MMELVDVIIVGGGAAGLSAALVLGRCRRSTIVFDHGQQRNAPAHALHGFLTRDGIRPAEFLNIALQQLQPYDTVAYRRAEVLDACIVDGGFEVTVADESRVRSRKLLLTTGVVDHLPEIKGLKEFLGWSVFHCPYCDGWEVRDQPIAIYGNSKRGHGLAMELLTWSRDLILCTGGPSRLTRKKLEELTRNNIEILETPIDHLEGSEKQLERIVFGNGDVRRCRAWFFTLGQEQRSPLPPKLGCIFTVKGAVRTGKYESTNIAGLYVAGDASRDVQLAIVAAAEGAEAAFAINAALAKEVR